MARCSQLTDVGFTTLARVSVASASWLHAITLFFIPKHVEKQNIYPLTHDGSHSFFLFYCLFQNCHELEKMDLEECVQVNEQSEPLKNSVVWRLRL